MSKSCCPNCGAVAFEVNDGKNTEFCSDFCWSCKAIQHAPPPVQRKPEGGAKKKHKSKKKKPTR